MPPRLFVTDVQVRSYEVDLAGVVNHAVFVNYLEHARMEIFRELGLSFDEWVRRGLMVVVRRMELDYHRPARLEQALRVESWVEELGRTSVHLGQVVRCRRDEEPVVSARVVGVFVGPDLRPAPLPEALVACFPPGSVGARP